MDSTKKTKGVTRSAVVSSCKGPIPKTMFATAKKQTISRVPLSDKKINGSTASVLKGKKLFDETSQFTKSEKVSAISDIASTIKTSKEKQEVCISNVTKATVCAEPEKETELLEYVNENQLVDALKPTEFNCMVDKEVSSNDDGQPEEVTPSVNSSNKKALSLVEEVHNGEKENKDSQVNEDESPPISSRLEEISNHLKSLLSATPLHMEMPEENSSYVVEPKTPIINQGKKDENVNTPWQTFSVHNSEVKNSLVQEYLGFLNTAGKEELKRLKGIGEKRATYILELRDESPNPFKNLDDLKEIGLSAKQIKGMMKKEVGGLFN